MRSLLARSVRLVVDSLVAAGQFCVYVPPVAPITAQIPVGPAAGGPGPGHPERLCPEVPLSAVEAALSRQLRGRPMQWPEDTAPDRAPLSTWSRRTHRHR
ncbi:DUF6059 family protein [Streptomyces sp. NPDC092296]|uniref:DUF6059 family protein n=1 Tax=Streptomyces sp. NPDC092296 TaxID=3366012 RepID=UPI003826B1BB